MTRPQRTVAIVYCLLVAYCGVWIPWHYDIGDFKGIKEGYALVWNGRQRVMEHLTWRLLPPAY